MNVYECWNGLNKVQRNLVAFYLSIVSTWHRIGNPCMFVEFIKNSMYRSLLLAGSAVSQSDTVEATRG